MSVDLVTESCSGVGRGYAERLGVNSSVVFAFKVAQVAVARDSGSLSARYACELTTCFVPCIESNLYKLLIDIRLEVTRYNGHNYSCLHHTEQSLVHEQGLSRDKRSRFSVRGPILEWHQDSVPHDKRVPFNSLYLKILSTIFSHSFRVSSIRLP